MTGCQCATTDGGGERLSEDDRYAALWWATKTAVAAFVDYRQPRESD
ncbi:hypothetical protein [Mycolicibacterium sp. P1-18]|nr:hypothetical protein [Mycolicibacterium sp. P1-18]